MKLEPEPLLRALGLARHEVPAALILEGSWWQQQRNRLRLSRLERARELPFPEMHLGYYRDRPVLYCCAYGAPRAVEPVHVFGSLGSSLAIQIGSCGALQPQVRTGDVIIPETVRIGEGTSQYYGGDTFAEGTPAALERAETALVARGLTIHRGRFVTTSALFAQAPERVERWRAEGYLGVDMETSAVFTAARALGMDAVSMVFAWDELLLGRSFLDAFTPEEKARQDRANLEIFEAALDLAAESEVRA